MIQNIIAARRSKIEVIPVSPSRAAGNAIAVGITANAVVLQRGEIDRLIHRSGGVKTAVDRHTS